MSFTKVKKGVCAAKGFVANGLNCGLNSDKNKNDLALVYSETQCQAAAVYTTNKVKGAPIQVTKAHLEASGHTAKAVIANSKNATGRRFPRWLVVSCLAPLPQNARHEHR